MGFTVMSNSFKDGDYLPSDFILSADFGFGCAGGNSRRTLSGQTRRQEQKASLLPATIPTPPLARVSGTGW